MQESEVLTKAFKEHERRRGQQEGFAHTPADALAFKHYRDVSKPYLTPAHAYRRPQCSASCPVLDVVS